MKNYIKEQAFFKGGSAAFLVMSPFQLLCAVEAISAFDIKDFFFEFVFVREYEHRNKQMMHMAMQMNLTYEAVFTDEIDVYELYSSSKEMPIKASKLYDRVFIGDYNSKHLHVEAYKLAKKGSCILYLDDGTSTICILKGIFNDGHTKSWIDKYQSLKYKKGTHRLHRFIQKKMSNHEVKLLDCFYTMYDNLKDTRFKLFPNNFDKLRESRRIISSNEKLVCIIGTVVNEFSESVLRENVTVLESIIWSVLSKVQQTYQKCKIVYIPHPRDNNLIISKFCEILNINYSQINESVEFYLLNSPYEIEAIWGFGSTALGVLRKLFLNTEIVNISITKGTITKNYNAIYSYYSKINIKQVEIRLPEKKPQTNTFISIVKNMIDFSFYVVKKTFNKIQ